MCRQYKSNSALRVSIPPNVLSLPSLLGKSVEDFKLWLPGALKQELQTLATLESLELSDYLRKTLVRVLLGESFHHRWRTMVGKLPDEVRRFEREI